MSSVLSMFLGALIGSLLILYVSFVYPVLIALVIIAFVSTFALVSSKQKYDRFTSHWVEREGPSIAK